MRWRFRLCQHCIERGQRHQDAAPKADARDLAGVDALVCESSADAEHLSGLLDSQCLPFQGLGLLSRGHVLASSAPSFEGPSLGTIQARSNFRHRGFEQRRCSLQLSGRRSVLAQLLDQTLIENVGALAAARELSDLILELLHLGSCSQVRDFSCRGLNDDPASELVGPSTFSSELAAGAPKLCSKTLDLLAQRDRLCQLPRFARPVGPSPFRVIDPLPRPTGSARRPVVAREALTNSLCVGVRDGSSSSRATMEAES